MGVMHVLCLHARIRFCSRCSLTEGDSIQLQPPPQVLGNSRRATGGGSTWSAPPTHPGDTHGVAPHPPR